MMQIDIPIRINLGADPTLEDLREAVEKTRKIPGGAMIKLEVIPGQRDSETTTLFIQGAGLLED